ncbi:MAG: S1 family peptidase, partial [Mycobacteriales bacterium]
MNFSGRAFGLLTILIVFFAVLPAAGLTQGDGGPEFRSDDIVKSTVRVVVYDSGHRRLGWGTGWIISASDFDKRAGNAIVVTTWNTIAKAAVGGYVQIIPGGGGPELPARVRSTSNETKIDFDLAFIEVKGLTAPALPVADTAPDSARPVYSSGYSFVADTNEASQWSSRASIQSGTVSKTFQGGMTRASQAPVDQIEHNTPLDPGYSGGPLLDRCGRVVGVNTKDGGIRIGEDVPVALSRGSRFALASNELISIANQEGVPFVPGHGDCSSSATPAATTAPSLPVAAPPPVQASPIQSTGDFFRANPIALGALVLAGLVALGFAVWLIMRGRRDN